MDTRNADILTKIRKLMALGESPSEAEAASALEKARILLARYGLSMADVETRSPEVVEDVLLEKKRLRTWESHLIYVITETTFTQALHVRRGDAAQILLIGREVNTRSAAELFAYLHLVILKLGRAHSAEVAHLESFKMGVVQRIGERLAAIGSGQDMNQPAGESPESAPLASDRQLAILMTGTAKKENESYIADRYGKTKAKRTGRRVDAESYLRGRAAGDGVSLNRQIS